MEAAVYLKMLADKNILDLNKLKHKYPEVYIREFVDLLRNSSYKKLPLPDFAGEELVYMENLAQVRLKAVRALLTLRDSREAFGLKAMEDEIASSLTIENIDFARDSVRKILYGSAPSDEQEERIFGMKKGLEFIANPENIITEKNMHSLFEAAIGPYLPEDSRLQPGSFYRHDSVYIVGQGVEHAGLPHGKLPEYMSKLVVFINAELPMNDLLKAAVIHFYIAYLHPYFDGNGRMARLMHLWYLRQQGYSSALFIPFSSYINRSRKEYYKAFTLAEENYKISGIMDVTPFLVYFIENVYNKLDNTLPQADTSILLQALNDGRVTEKEKALWNFVLSAYGSGEFSTKQLEKDFGRAAYATIRSFVLKFEKMGLLKGQRYGNKIKYAVKSQQP